MKHIYVVHRSMKMLVNEIMEYVTEIGKMLFKEKEEVSYI